MASAKAKSKVVRTVESVELTLSPDEAKVLAEYLDILGENARVFRVANPCLYGIQSELYEALEA